VDVRIKATVAFRISGENLEDALVEYDEVEVSELLREVLDKAIACDSIEAHVIEGPNSLEDYDKLKEG